MKRYHQRLQVQQAQQVGRNEVGDIVTTGTEEWLEVSPCRDEPAGKGSTVRTGNGDVVTYSSNVFAPADCPDVAENANVRVLDEQGGVVLEGICKRFHRYCHYAKVWI